MIMFRNLTLFGFLLFGVLFSAACEADNGRVDNARGSMANANKTAPAQVNSSTKPKIVAFGDSLTAGFGLTEKESYPYLLQEKLQAAGYDYEVVNAGVSGEKTAGGLDRIDWNLNQPNIDVLILELGANDILQGNSIELMKKNLNEMIRRAKAKNIKVLLCGMYAPPNYGAERQREVVKAFKDLADEHKVAFLPFFLEGVGGIKTLNQADGIHPNAEGAKKVADTVYKGVLPLLKKS